MNRLLSSSTMTGITTRLPDTRVLLPAVVVVGTVIVIAGNAFGLWWITLLVGLAIGLLLAGGRLTFGAAALAGVLGWGLPLAWQALSVPIGDVASVVAGIVGLGASNGFIVILLVLVLALLLALASAWVGVTLRRLILPPQQAAVEVEPLPEVAAPEPAPVRATSRAGPKRRRKR